MAPPDADALRRLRLLSLGLSTAVASDVVGLVRWFGAMQAQDVASAKWSLGLRLAATEAEIDAALGAAFGRGDVVRTWPMRGTLHLVPGADVGWMLEVAGVKVLPKVKRRWEELDLDARTRARALDLLGSACTGRRVERAALLSRLDAAGISTAGQRGYHLLVAAALAGVLCAGPDDTFARLDELVPSPVRLSSEEATARLAARYFQSHGPATTPDLARWTGWNLGETRRAIAAAGGALTTLVHGGVEHHLSPKLWERSADRPAAALTLPGFDELVLGYADRGLHLAEGDLDRVVPGGNGVFRATLVREGRVVGTWSRTVRAKTVAIEAAPFAAMPGTARKAFTAALEAYGRYLGRAATVTWAP